MITICFQLKNSIIKILNKRNCDFTYKLHPDRADETFDIYKNKIDKFEYNKFEKIYSDYETIVFSYPHSTTFFYALEKSQKIIFFDNEDENYLEKKLIITFRKKQK